MEVHQLKTPIEAAMFLLPRFRGMEIYARTYSSAKFRGFCQSQLSGGIGMHIRNELGLWEEDNAIIQYCKTNLNTSHPDDVSGLIIEQIQYLIIISEFLSILANYK